MTNSRQLANRTVLISGASVAGPALAYWLRRYGFTPTVVELAPELRAGGYKVDLRGVAMQVVERPGQIRMQTTMMRLVNRLPWKDLAMRPIMKPLNQAANALTLAAY